MQATFSPIAKTNLFIKTRNNNFNNKLLGEYWIWIIKNSGVSTSLIQTLLNSEPPKLIESKVEYVAENEIVKNFLVQKSFRTN